MSHASTTDPWLACRKQNQRARVRLFCFPYGGSGASLFRGWSLPGSVDLCPVQIPGRETRFRERPFTRLEPLVEQLVQALRSYLDLPFALFGHSIGALIAFELARRLQRRLRLTPLRLFASAYGAPHLPRDGQPLHALPAAEFCNELERLNGTAAGVIANKELIDLLLPTLRADFAVCETYRYRRISRFDVRSSPLAAARTAPFARRSWKPGGCTPRRRFACAWFPATISSCTRPGRPCYRPWSPSLPLEGVCPGRFGPARLAGPTGVQRCSTR